MSRDLDRLSYTSYFYDSGGVIKGGARSLQIQQSAFMSPNYQVQRRHARVSARGRAATSRARGSAARGRALYVSPTAATNIREFPSTG
jgi:hypothetical protein